MPNKHSYYLSSIALHASCRCLRFASAELPGAAAVAGRSQAQVTNQISNHMQAGGPELQKWNHHIINNNTYIYNDATCHSVTVFRFPFFYSQYLVSEPKSYTKK